MRQLLHEHDGFVTTGKRPFRPDSFPMRLFQKAKKLGVWDPADIDFTLDKTMWAEASEAEKQGSLQILSSFQAGEEAVTLDLLPLMMAVAKEGRIEDEMYLTTFLFEEAKHVEFFSRWFREVPGIDLASLGQLHSPNYRRLFYQELPESLHILSSDPSPKNQLRASVTYNMIVEGVLAETGYFLFDLGAQLRGQNHMTGLRSGIQKLRQDESRHIAYGIYLISRILAENPTLWSEAEARMRELEPLAFGFIEETIQGQLKQYGELPSGADPKVIVGFARGQYNKRFERLKKARQQSLAEIETIAFETEATA